MPSDYYRAGDPCACKVFVCNPDTPAYENVPLFVILDVFGTYFFAPAFNEFDYYTIDSLLQGIFEQEVLPTFSWPEGAGSADGIYWYAAMTDADISELLGEMDSFEFGWGE